MTYFLQSVSLRYFSDLYVLSLQISDVYLSKPNTSGQVPTTNGRMCFSSRDTELFYLCCHFTPLLICVLTNRWRPLRTTLWGVNRMWKDHAMQRYSCYKFVILIVKKALVSFSLMFLIQNFPRQPYGMDCGIFMLMVRHVLKFIKCLSGNWLSGWSKIFSLFAVCLVRSPWHSFWLQYCE